MIGNIDWNLLRKQKSTLIEQIDNLEKNDNIEAASDLNGILHILDELQDKGAKKFGERMVFKN